MYVCKNCHDKDAKAIGCMESYENHAGSEIEIVCAICGNIKYAKWCSAYQKLLELKPEKNPILEDFHGF